MNNEMLAEVERTSIKAAASETDAAALTLHYFRSGFHCSEAILRAFNEAYYLGLDEKYYKIATGFGSGLGKSGCCCGAVTGAVMVMGLVAGRNKNYESERIVYDASHELHEKFRSIHKALCCRALTKNVIWNSVEHKNICADYVLDAARLTNEIITDKLCKYLPLSGTYSVAIKKNPSSLFRYFLAFVIKYKKELLFICLLGLIFALNAIFGWTDILSNKENLALAKKALEENLLLAVLLYIVATAIGSVLALPGFIFALSAGFIFGPLWGIVLCSVSTAIGASLAFLVGRYFLRDTIQPIAMRNRYVKKIFTAADGKNDMFLLMVTRLVPLFPYNLQNFAYGITNIKLWSYALYSWLFMLPGISAYTLIAAGINDEKSRFLCLFLAIILFVSVTVLSFLLKKKSALTKGD